jgi:hypothetical protein
MLYLVAYLWGEGLGTHAKYGENNCIKIYYPSCGVSNTKGFVLAYSISRH